MEKIIPLSHGSLVITYSTDPSDLPLFVEGKLYEGPVSIIYNPGHIDTIEESIAYLKVRRSVIISFVQLELSKFPDFYNYVTIDYRDFFVDKMPVIGRGKKQVPGSYEMELRFHFYL